MYLHSIIIPCRNRAAELDACLASIRASARKHHSFRAVQLEILVVDTLSDEEILPDTFTKVIHDEEPLPVVELRNGKTIQMYNRFRALNLGIEAASGDLLTFLDCDSIVGPDFLAAWQNHIVSGDPPTKLCYRVRYLPREKFDKENPTEALAHLAKHETFRIAKEAYDKADNFRAGDEESVQWIGGQRIFGNSQFSIPRKTLGDLRYNEDFVGMGWGDVWMNREIERRHRPDYRAIMVTDPNYAIMQISTVRHEADWFNSEVLEQNERRYYDS